MAAGSVAQAAQVVFTQNNAILSTNGALVTQPSTVPTLNVSVGDNVTLYVAARKTGSTSGSFVNGMGLNIAGSSSDGASVQSLSFAIQNPTQQAGTDDDGNPVFINRWVQTDNGTMNSGGLLVNNSLAATLASSTAQIAFPFSSNTLFKYYGDFAFKALTPGTYNLYFQVGPKNISESDNTGTSNFGFGDAAVSNATVGAQSAQPDAVIVIAPIPEPASLGLLGTAVLGVAARRRRA